MRPANGQSRIVARHAAAAGDVNVLLRKGVTTQVIYNLENPDQEAAVVGAEPWFVGIYPAGSWHPLFQTNLSLAPNKTYFDYAVGSPAKGSFSVLLQTLNLGS